MKRGREVMVSRIPHGQGYVWGGYWGEDPNDGIPAVAVGRVRKVVNYVHSAKVIWLNIGGYLVIDGLQENK